MPSDKLSTQAISGVFIGYSITQKGYRCNDPISQCLFVTNNAFFDENTFYFPSTIESPPPLLSGNELAARRIEDSSAL